MPTWRRLLRARARAERHLPVPIVLAAAAALLAPLRHSRALAAACLARCSSSSNAELRLDQYPYFEAPSLAIGAFANRIFIWDAADIERALIAAALISVALLAAHSFVRSRTVGLAIAVVAACAVATWALTTEIYASRGLNIFSERMHQISPKPVDWVDQATGGEPALFLGQQIGKDKNPIWLLEFWNYRSTRSGASTARRRCRRCHRTSASRTGR